MTSGLSLVGVNLSGAEFGTAGGKYGWNYIYPTMDEIDYYASKGVNVIRLPFLWERLQPTLNGALDSDELARMDTIVSYAAKKGVEVVLDPHDYGGYCGNLVGSDAVSNASFADFWSKLADHYKIASNVMFGLMNEPNQQSATSWLQSENAAIAAIRKTGATQEILVQGSYWDGGSSWTTSDNASVIGKGIVDPGNNYAFEVHQYLDQWSSGTNPTVVSETIGVERLTAVTQWAEKNGARLFLGEFGVAQDATSLKAMQNMLSYMSQHSTAWQGATYWGAGPWWGDYMYSIEPSKGADKPQMQILQSFTPTAVAADTVGSVATPVAGTVATPVGVATIPVVAATPVSLKLTTDSGTNGTDKITNSAILSGGGSGNASVNFTVDGVASGTTAKADQTGAWRYEPASLADGAHTIVATETVSGTTSTASLTFTLDRTNPTPQITTTGGTIASATQTVGGTGEAGSTIALFNEGAAVGQPITVDYKGKWTTQIALGLGSNAIQAKATDLAGNTGSSQTVAFTYDHAPVITSGGGGTMAKYAVTRASTFITTVHATDSDTGDSVSYALIDPKGQHVGTTAGLTIDTKSGALSFTGTPAAGTYTVNAVATDKYGASAVQTLKVKVSANMMETGDTGDHGVTDTFVFNGGPSRMDLMNFRAADLTSGGKTDPHSVLALAHTLFNGIAAGASGSAATRILASHSFQFGADTYLVTDQHALVQLHNVNRTTFLANPSNVAFT